MARIDLDAFGKRLFSLRKDVDILIEMLVVVHRALQLMNHNVTDRSHFSWEFNLDALKDALEPFQPEVK